MAREKAAGEMRPGFVRKRGPLVMNVAAVIGVGISVASYYVLHAGWCYVVAGVILVARLTFGLMVSRENKQEQR